MALFGPRAMSDLSSLSGVKRKLDFGAVRSVMTLLGHPRDVRFSAARFLANDAEEDRKHLV